MPCIKVIESTKIYIYLRDHNPPHFHAIYAEFEELIEIKSLKVYTGTLPKKQHKKVISWARDKQDYIMAKWKEFNPDS